MVQCIRSLRCLVVWIGQIKCGGCGTVSDKETSVTPSELYDLPKSKGSANLVQKVRFFSCLRVQPSTGRCRDETLVVQEVLHCGTCGRVAVSEGFAADIVLCLFDFGESCVEIGLTIHL